MLSLRYSSSPSKSLPELEKAGQCAALLRLNTFNACNNGCPGMEVSLESLELEVTNDDCSALQCQMHKPDSDVGN